MTTPVLELFDEFKRELDELKDTIADAQQAGVKISTLRNVAELALLRTHSAFEWYLQETFYLCMIDDSSVVGSGSVVRLATRAHAELVLQTSGTRREAFLSWLPLDRTIERAELYLAEGHPFVRLAYRPVEHRAMTELVIVRNAVAHPGDHAQGKFLALASSKKYQVDRPADYLLSLQAGTAEILLLMTRAQRIAEALSKSSEQDANALLEPEAPFRAGQTGPAGWYICGRCAHMIELSVADKLGACEECGSPEPCELCQSRPTTSTEWTRLILATAVMP